VGRWLVLPDVNGSDVKRLDQVFNNYWKKRNSGAALERRWKMRVLQVIDGVLFKRKICPIWKN